MDGTAKKRQKGSQARTYKKVDLTMSDSPSLTIYLELHSNKILFYLFKDIGARERVGPMFILISNQYVE